MTTKSTPPPPDSDSSDEESISLPHHEHEAITNEAIVVWRSIAEMLGLQVNGPDACDAIDVVIHALYDQRSAGLEFSGRLLSDLATHEDMEADDCRGDAVNFSAKRIALARERSAAFTTAATIVFRHMQEMTEEHTHFDPAKAMDIKKISDEIINGGESENAKEKEDCDKSN